MDSRRRNSSRARKRKPRLTQVSKPAEANDCPEPADALNKLSRAIALVETVSFAMRIHEHEPDFGSIAVSLEVAVGKLGTAYGEIDLALMSAEP